MTRVLRELQYQEKQSEKNARSSDQEVALPKIEKDLIHKYISELEKAKNDYVYPGEKEKVCPLYPLVAFPKINNNTRNQDLLTSKPYQQNPVADD